MYMCRLRYINDPVLSSLKMEGIRLLFFSQWPILSAPKILDFSLESPCIFQEFVSIVGNITGYGYYMVKQSHYRPGQALSVSGG
jgi:hypothetical protein